MKHFSGLITEDMMANIETHPLKLNPHGFIIHVRTNDSRSNQNPETIARNIVEVCNSKTDTNKVLNSSIVSRLDNLNGKVHHVDIFLNKFFRETFLSIES